MGALQVTQEVSVTLYTLEVLIVDRVQSLCLSFAKALPWYDVLHLCLLDLQLFLAVEHVSVLSLFVLVHAFLKHLPCFLLLGLFFLGRTN